MNSLAPPAASAGRSPPEYERLPFRPGTSPFHMKGVGYRGHLEYVQSSVPGGLRAMIDGLVDPDLKEFYARTFLASTWYDVLPILPATEVAARLLGMTFEQFVRFRVRLQAQSDARGVYKLLLKLASPELVAKNLPRLASLYYNFGTTTVRLLRPRVVEAVRVQVPKPVASWYAMVSESYCESALEIAGAREPRMRTVDTARDGAISGVDTVSLRFELTWE
jgi:hypothetical protein